MPRKNAEQSTERYSVPAVQKAGLLLEALARFPHGAGVNELAATAGVPKSSASLILGTLEELGFANRSDDGKYRLGIKLYHLGTAAVWGLDVRKAALPHMEALSRDTGHSVHLAILDGDEAVIIEKVPGTSFVQFNTWVGKRVMLHLSSYGKCLASGLPEAEVERIVAQKGLPQRTAKTVSDLPSLLHQLRQFRELGYAIEDEEDEPGIRCIAAAVRSHTGQVVAAVSITALTNDLPITHFADVAARVRAAADAISYSLGCPQD
jgi:DNA-binding IclR family transcriptional regulator